MNSDQVEFLFAAALSLPQADRKDFVKRECGDNAALQEFQWGQVNTFDIWYSQSP